MNRKRIWKANQSVRTLLAMKRLSIVLLLSALATSATALPIIQDDYAKARAEAQRRRLPLFIEVWAPW
jgi:hypothetical protein